MISTIYSSPKTPPNSPRLQLSSETIQYSPTIQPGLVKSLSARKQQIELVCNNFSVFTTIVREIFLQNNTRVLMKVDLARQVKELLPTLTLKEITDRLDLIASLFPKVFHIEFISPRRVFFILKSVKSQDYIHVKRILKWLQQ
jgi:hypothetical protein